MSSLSSSVVFVAFVGLLESGDFLKILFSLDLHQAPCGDDTIEPEKKERKNHQGYVSLSNQTSTSTSTVTEQTSTRGGKWTWVEFLGGKGSIKPSI